MPSLILATLIKIRLQGLNLFAGRYLKVIDLFLSNLKDIYDKPFSTGHMALIQIYSWYSKISLGYFSFDTLKYL